MKTLLLKYLLREVGIALSRVFFRGRGSGICSWALRIALGDHEANLPLGLGMEKGVLPHPTGAPEQPSVNGGGLRLFGRTMIPQSPPEEQPPVVEDVAPGLPPACPPVSWHPGPSTEVEGNPSPTPRGSNRNCPGWRQIKMQERQTWKEKEAIADAEKWNTDLANSEADVFAAMKRVAKETGNSSWETHGPQAFENILQAAAKRGVPYLYRGRESFKAILRDGPEARNYKEFIQEAENLRREETDPYFKFFRSLDKGGGQ